MSRKPVSLKARGVRKKRGKTKQLSWQTPIDAYFGGKKAQVPAQVPEATSDEVDLQNSLDRIDLTDKNVSNENLKPVSAPTASLCSTGRAGGTLVEVFNQRSQAEEESQSSNTPVRDVVAAGGSHGNGCDDYSNHDNGSRGSSSDILQDQTLNTVTPHCWNNHSSSHHSVIGAMTAQFSPSDVPLDEAIQPPLTSDDNAVGDNSKISVNPFAKLQQCRGGCGENGYFTTETSVSKGTNEQGFTPLTSRKKKGLSLKVRKRKFVPSPSKPRQEKPVKQVIREQQADNLAGTPPLFTTPTPSPHCHIVTPSLFTPDDRNILQQYTMQQTTQCCRRLSLADLESSSIGSEREDVGGACGVSNSDDVIAKSSDDDPKSCDQLTKADQSNFGSSDTVTVMDQSCTRNESCDPPSKSHDVTNQSHDIFDQSNSFDEFIKQFSPISTDDITLRSHDPAQKSCDPTEDITQKSHDQTDDITGRSHDLIRHLVLERVVQEGEGGGRGPLEVVLRLLDQRKMTERLVYLRDEWVQVPVSPGDTVQINPPLEWNEDQWDSPCVIDGTNKGSVVVSPDMLITSTAIATSITCPRRAILADLFKSVSKDNIAMVTGSLLHQVFQGVLVKWAESSKREGFTSVISRDDVDEMMRSVLSTPEALNQMYSLGMSDEEGLSHLSSLTPSILNWCGRYLHPSPLPGRGELEFKRSVCDSDGTVCVSVDHVDDIEENIWSPRFGLKGKVDATLQIKERRGREGVESTYRVPLEIKTGKMYWKQGSLDHRAQLTLYALMLRDRYRDDHIPGGLLYYMKADHMHGLAAESHDIRSLLMARNRVAGHYGNLASHMTLPDMLKESHVCKRCPYLPQCCLTHKSMEEGTAETSGLGDLFISHTQHLSQEHLSFFSHWCDLVLREDGRGKLSGTEFWNYSTEDREKDGVAMGNMQACRPQRISDHVTSRHLQKFIRPCHRHHVTPSPPHSPHTLTLNERLVVSRQDGRSWAIAMGTVTMATDREVELLLDRPVPWESGLEYRLDVAPGYHGSTSLSNLARLCSDNSERDEQLRRLIIDLCPPRYHPSPPPHLTAGTSPVSHLTEGTSPPSHGLNTNQKAALRKVLCSQDYTLILGRPGTGKTTTISRLVQTLVAMGASVLVTSYTHSAVDNILLKLKENTMAQISKGHYSNGGTNYGGHSYQSSPLLQQQGVTNFDPHRGHHQGVTNFGPNGSPHHHPIVQYTPQQFYQDTQQAPHSEGQIFVQGDSSYAPQPHPSDSPQPTFSPPEEQGVLDTSSVTSSVFSSYASNAGRLSPNWSGSHMDQRTRQTAFATSSQHSSTKSLEYHNIHIDKEQRLGSGSYGAVYRAYSNQLPCAAKVLHRALSSPEDPGADAAMQKFMDECYLLSMIRHPNIVQYLSTTFEKGNSGRPVLLMEICDENLTTFLERAPPLYHEQLNICVEVALALAYLHLNQLYHRDLSSNNVLLNRGQAKITDFGMSKLAEFQPTTLCPGNPVYMSPEALKEPPKYTDKLDVFSFGVLMVQIMTQKFPDPSNRYTVEYVEPSDQFPDGEIHRLVPESVRRNNHLKLIPESHPLKQVSLDCLCDKEGLRPTAQQLSINLTTLKTKPNFTQSLHLQQRSKTEPHGKVPDSVHDLERHYQSIQDDLQRQLNMTQTKLDQALNQLHHLSDARTKLALKEEQLQRQTRLLSEEEEKHKLTERELEKLKLEAQDQQVGVDFLRLGSKHVVHPSLHCSMPSHSQCTTVAELTALYSSKPVVATTCLGVNHTLFSRRRFDYCIVDEASQLTLPVSLGPLRCADVFVLVGDHYQLPPLVTDQEARERGLGVSLFRLLSERHPDSMVMLDEQYRMNSDIMLLSNTLFYNHELKCGDVGVASGRLLLPLLAQLSSISSPWLQRAVRPDQPVVFLNTDTVCDDGGRESRGSRDKIWNKTEVNIVTKIIATFIQYGVSGRQVGVVTPYRYQQQRIREALAADLNTDSIKVEVNTVDRYQGRDKDCVIISFVRSNTDKSVGNLLCDWRRVNVALTRARHKLVMVGSLTTLPSSPSLNSLLHTLTDKQWIIDITT